MNKFYACAVTLLTLFTCINPAHAIPLQWYLSGVTFNDNTTATGSYFYDADTWTYSNWDITTSSGSGSTGPIPGFNYTTANTGETWGGYPHAFRLNDTGYWDDDCACNVPWSGSAHEFYWILNDPMTNAGGTISMFLSNESYTDSTFTISYRSITQGWVTSIAPAAEVEAPEPASLGLLGLGLLVMGLGRSRAGRRA